LLLNIKNIEKLEKYMKKLGVSLLASMMMLSACSTFSNTSEFEVIEKDPTTMEEKKPVLYAETKKENGEIFLMVETDLIVSKDNYGKKKINGQGHIHVYINNGEKEGVTDFPYELKGLKKGENQVKISLHNNDHTPYGVSETLEIENN
jgi:hypothetical protein